MQDTEPVLMRVKCSVCACLMRRTGDHNNTDLPRIYTRTLVDGRFLPSCSFRCAQILRGSVEYGAKP